MQLQTLGALAVLCISPALADTVFFSTGTPDGLMAAVSQSSSRIGDRTPPSRKEIWHVLSKTIEATPTDGHVTIDTGLSGNVDFGGLAQEYFDSLTVNRLPAWSFECQIVRTRPQRELVPFCHSSYVSTINVNSGTLIGTDDLNGSCRRAVVIVRAPTRAIPAWSPPPARSPVATNKNARGRCRCRKHTQSC